ncbi:TolC family outer membrane protein [Saliniramus sp.]|uniref:TolC family outer membrane protein n=1 Tax=Saliniramus sp. TaxID=2986772 RepID=UPI002CD3FECA|nr:TolC family outer membrane protein [Saliniramus sp.]HMB11829.1 TolC family outer membrane protein [Saliniramus sp.]
MTRANPRSFVSFVATTALLLTGFAMVAMPGGHQAHAETIDTALARAYQNSPIINASRAGLRATNEGVPQARSGYRPRINATADIGSQITWRPNPVTGAIDSRSRDPRGIGLEITQNIFDSGRTGNAVRRAETQVLAARMRLEATVQQTLFRGAEIYMNVLRDTAILNLQRNNVEVLDEQLRQSQDRFEVGEVTRTDVAQAESRLASARSQVSLAEANLRANIGRYRQIIGSQPRELGAGRAPERLIPGNLDSALHSGLTENPSIIAARHALDGAQIAVKVAEAELLPRASVRGSIDRRFDAQQRGDRQTSASITAQLTVPLYQGGEVSARVRAAKETVNEFRFELEQAREEVRANVITAWGSLEAASAQIQAAEIQVDAAETALTGVREEARVGQRTTLDVLNAQQELLNARVNLITAQRDRIVAAFSLVQAMGRLTPRQLGLAIAEYDSREHYEQVRHRIWGTSTPSGD